MFDTDKPWQLASIRPYPNEMKPQLNRRSSLLTLQRHFVGRLPPAGAGSGDPAYNDGSWKPHGSRSVAVVLDRGWVKPIGSNRGWLG